MYIYIYIYIIYIYIYMCIYIYVYIYIYGFSAFEAHQDVGCMPVLAFWRAQGLGFRAVGSVLIEGLTALMGLQFRVVGLSLRVVMQVPKP